MTLRAILLLLILWPTLTFGQLNMCAENTFWATDGDSLYEFELDNNAATYTGNAIATAGPNIAICNNLNGTTPSPTFYGTTADKFKPNYYDGNAWVECTPNVSPLNLYNPGGYRNFLYYMVGAPNAPVKRIVKFDGTDTTTIYKCPGNRNITVADIITDTLGNCIVFTGNGGIATDTIKIISPQGVVIDQYPFSLNATHAYGAFYLNNTIYIGFGNQNPNYGDSLLPIMLGNASALKGTPIAMPDTIVFIDLASCNDTKTPTGLNNAIALKGLNIYPNPAVNNVTINWQLTGNETANIRVFDRSGKQILSTNKINPGYILSTQSMADGLYFVQVILADKISTKKLIIQQ